MRPRIITQRKATYFAYHYNFFLENQSALWLPRLPNLWTGGLTKHHILSTTTYCSMRSTFYIYIWLIVSPDVNRSTELNQISVEKCPEICSCSPRYKDSGLVVEVQCGDRKLTSVPFTTFDQPPSILNVSFNDLNTLKENSFSSYRSVEYLYLQYCKLHNINEKAFQDLKNLSFVDLSGNGLTSISPDLFKGNNLLQQLIFQTNDLSDLQWNMSLLNGPESLQYLDLQSCKLSNLSSETFSKLPNLKKLDISNNNLVCLNSDTLSSLRHLEDVHLEGNRWKCGPDFQGLLFWMQTKLRVSHKKPLKCWYKNDTQKTWNVEKRSSLCCLNTIPLVTPSHNPNVITNANQKSSVAPSTNTTPKPTTPSEQETEIISTGMRIIIFVVSELIILIVLTCVYINYKKHYKKLYKALSRNPPEEQ